MEWVRGAKGQGKNQLNYLHEHDNTPQAPEDDAPWKTMGNPVAMLETDNRYVDISNLDEHFPKLTNRYSVLSETDVDYDEPMKVLPKPPSATVQCCQRNLAPAGKRRWKSGPSASARQRRCPTWPKVRNRPDWGRCALVLDMSF